MNIKEKLEQYRQLTRELGDIIENIFDRYVKEVLGDSNSYDFISQCDKWKCSDTHIDIELWYCGGPCYFEIPIEFLIDYDAALAKHKETKAEKLRQEKLMIERAQLEHAAAVEKKERDLLAELKAKYES